MLNLVRSILKADLERHNTIHISERDENILRSLPVGTGIILTPNHADETDPRICLDLSRRCLRVFQFMCNREAFDELYGLAGMGLQGIGYFSIERGGHDQEAKEYSTKVVQDGKDALVIFPEGEIFYLNESLQPFHSGAIDIGMQAIAQVRKERDPQWTAFIVPISIKYHYSQSIDKILKKRIAAMEAVLKQKIDEHSLQKRLSLIQSRLLAREEAAYKIAPDATRLAQLSVRIAHARETILQQVEAKNTASFNSQARTIDQAWQMSAHLREKLGQPITAAQEKELKSELAALAEVAQLVSWQPQYVESRPSGDRMAEMILKLERELYRIKRPKQLAKRDVYVSVGEPIDLSQYIEEYQQAPHLLRHKLAEQLRDTIQTLINLDQDRSSPINNSARSI